MVFEAYKYDESKLKNIRDKILFEQAKDLNLKRYEFKHPFKYYWYLLTNKKDKMKNIKLGKTKLVKK